MSATEAATLSEREKETLRLLLGGHDAKSIAATLGLSVYTVNDRLREARRKLGVSSSREAARRLAEMEGQDPNILGGKDLGSASTSAPPARSEAQAAPRLVDHRLTWLLGGMLIMSLIIIAGALSTMNASITASAVTEPAATAVAPVPETEASAAARQWVALLDKAQWDASWESAGALFKAQLTSPQWSRTIASLRKPLGPVQSRTLQSMVPTKTLPGAPDGDYQVLQFQTRFAHKPEAIETIVMAREAAGWHVSGYFIR